jgi:hypothetical protein
MRSAVGNQRQEAPGKAGAPEEDTGVRERPKKFKNKNNVRVEQQQ